MKKLLFIGVLLAMACGMQAENVLTASDIVVKPGEEGTIEIAMTNSDPISGFEFSLTLPEGLSIPTEMNEDEEEVLAVTLSRGKSKHTLEIAEQSTKGVYKLLSYSSSNQTYKESSGTIVTVKVKATADFAGGTATISGITLSTAEAVQFTPADVEFKIGNTTGINEISAEKPATVYDLKGNQVRKNATSVEGLSKGVYIINNKKVIVK